MTNTSHATGRYQQAGRVHAAQLKEGLRIAESCARANKATCEELRAHNAALLAALREIVRRDESHDGRHQYAAIARAAIAAATGRT